VDYSGGTASVKFNMIEGVILSESSLYVGNTPLPLYKMGHMSIVTVDPEKFSLHGTDTTYDVTGLSGNIYVVAHVTVSGSGTIGEGCGDQENRRDEEEKREKLHCMVGTEVANQNSEEHEVSSSLWTNGKIARSHRDDALGPYLGRLGSDSPEMFRTFELPLDAASVRIAFDFYQIGKWASSDALIVRVGTNELVFSNLNNAAALDENAVVHEGSLIGRLGTTKDSIYWVHDSPEENDFMEVNVDDGTAVIRDHFISIVLPSEYFSTMGTIRVGFEVLLKTKTCFGGIHNFMVRALPVCDKYDDIFAPATPSLFNVASEPTADASELSGAYCSARDFPCGENGEKVNVCHFSARKGYQTFCVEEPDSDVVRFYSTDYCGPCVGGFEKE